jgi:hypothetical protein
MGCRHQGEHGKFRKGGEIILRRTSRRGSVECRLSIHLETRPISSTASHNIYTMPPRVGARASNITAPQQCLRTSSNARQSVASQRDFSQSSGQQFHATCKNDTRLRRNMFSWLNGPGRVFREALPGSTNYLSAYDRSGNLTRLRAGAEQEEENKVDVSKLNAEEKAKYEQDKEAKAAEDRNKLPRERASDLRPYPLNMDFRSQSVLSEELRQEIYKKIVDEKVDLSIVSALYGVDMRRVAAVVRLKTIEKNWVSEVCCVAPSAIAALPLPNIFYDETYKNSISLYDTHMDTTPIYSDLSTINQSIHQSVSRNKR